MSKNLHFMEEFPRIFTFDEP